MTAAAPEPTRRADQQSFVASDEVELLARAYAAYNEQDVDGLLALVSDDVDWPDGTSRLQGKAALRAYWTTQWTRTHTNDRPVAYTRRPDARVAVQISQIVRALDGSVLSTGSVCHVHRITGPHIVQMHIEDA